MFEFLKGSRAEQWVYFYLVEFCCNFELLQDWLFSYKKIHFSVQYCSNLVEEELKRWDCFYSHPERFRYFRSLTKRETLLHKGREEVRFLTHFVRVGAFCGYFWTFFNGWADLNISTIDNFDFGSKIWSVSTSTFVPC